MAERIPEPGWFRGEEEAGSIDLSCFPRAHVPEYDIEKLIQETLSMNPYYTRLDAIKALAFSAEQHLYNIIGADPCDNMDFRKLERQIGEAGKWARMRRDLRDLLPEKCAYLEGI